MSRHRLLSLLLVLLTAGLIAVGCGDDDDGGGDGGVDEPSVTLESPESDTVEGLEDAQQEAQEQADEAQDQAEEGIADAREACIESVKDSFDGEQEEQAIETCEESFPE